MPLSSASMPTSSDLVVFLDPEGLGSPSRPAILSADCLTATSASYRPPSSAVNEIGSDASGRCERGSDSESGDGMGRNWWNSGAVEKAVEATGMRRKKMPPSPSFFSSLSSSVGIRRGSRVTPSSQNDKLVIGTTRRPPPVARGYRWKKRWMERVRQGESARSGEINLWRDRPS